MGSGEFVRLKCRAGTLDALATGLIAFGATEGAPDWLIAGVWLCTGDTRYLATVSVDVLADGFVARSLCIQTRDELMAQVQAELPDVAARVRARANGLALPEMVEAPLPRSLRPWGHRNYTLSVLVRASRPEAGANQITCGLLFQAEEGPSLLVGTDPTVLAMVLSEDAELIDRYCEACQTFSPAEYLSLRGA